LEPVNDTVPVLNVNFGTVYRPVNEKAVTDVPDCGPLIVAPPRTAPLLTVHPSNVNVPVAPVAVAVAPTVTPNPTVRVNPVLPVILPA